MATYMILGNYTQKGIEGIKDRPARAERLRKRCEDNGCEFKAGYMALGRYDLVLMIEAPDEKSMAKVLIGAGMTGNIRTETLRLFDQAEGDEIVAGV